MSATGFQTCPNYQHWPKFIIESTTESQNLRSQIICDLFTTELNPNPEEKSHSSPPFPLPCLFMAASSQSHYHLRQGDPLILHVSHASWRDLRIVLISSPKYKTVLRPASETTSLVYLYLTIDMQHGNAPLNSLNFHDRRGNSRKLILLTYISSFKRRQAGRWSFCSWRPS